MDGWMEAGEVRFEARHVRGRRDRDGCLEIVASLTALLALGHEDYQHLSSTLLKYFHLAVLLVPGCKAP